MLRGVNDLRDFYGSTCNVTFTDDVEEADGEGCARPTNKALNIHYCTPYNLIELWKS